MAVAYSIRWIPARLVVITRLQAGGSILGRGKIFLLPRKHLDRLWGTPSLVFSGYRASSPGLNLSGFEANHSHLLPRLRVTGTVPLLGLYAFMVCTSGTLPLPSPLRMMGKWPGCTDRLLLVFCGCARPIWWLSPHVNNGKRNTFLRQ
jgi:hypothetical protein